MPDDAVLLVRSIGTDNVKRLEDALLEQKVPYFIGAARKDEVSFYVQRERRDEVERLVKDYLTK